MHAQFALQGLGLPQDEPCMVDDALAGGRQRHAAPVTREEGDAEFLLHAAERHRAGGRARVARPAPWVMLRASAT